MMRVVKVLNTSVVLAVEDGNGEVILMGKGIGFRKRYGFIYVDRDDFDVKQLRRIKKDSYYWYQNVIRTNGEEL